MRGEVSFQLPGRRFPITKAAFTGYLYVTCDMLGWASQLDVISLLEVFCALCECFSPAGAKTSTGNAVGLDVGLC